MVLKPERICNSLRFAPEGIALFQKFSKHQPFRNTNELSYTVNIEIPLHLLNRFNNIKINLRIKAVKHF